MPSCSTQSSTSGSSVQSCRGHTQGEYLGLSPHDACRVIEVLTYPTRVDELSARDHNYMGKSALAKRAHTLRMRTLVLLTASCAERKYEARGTLGLESSRASPRRIASDTAPLGNGYVLSVDEHIPRDETKAPGLVRQCRMRSIAAGCRGIGSGLARSR